MSTRDRQALSARTAAPASNTPVGVSVLPIELMVSILDHLAPGELSTAALVSRGFRAAARLAGLRLHYRLIWKLDAPACRQLDSLLEFVAHVLRHEWLISFNWVCYLSRPAEGDSEAHVFQETEDQISAVIASIVALMPYLVHLGVQLPSAHGRELDQLLLVPAPRLLTFELRRNGQVPCTHAIPATLFSGSAPVLHAVSLHSLVLPNEAIPAFCRVRKLCIAYEGRFRPTELARSFPLLRSLHLHYAFPTAGLSPDSAGRTLARLHLDELTVGESWQPEMRMIDNVLPLRDILLVRQHGCIYDLDEPLWRTEIGPLSVRARAAAPAVTMEGPVEVIIIPRDGAWRRVFLLESWDDIERGPICTRPPFPAHMEYLRVDGHFLEDFLHGRGTYAALRRIRIDVRGQGKSVLPPRCRVGDPRVVCPTLDEVAIYTLDGPRTMESLEIMRLARALGQPDRAPYTRAQLVLVGVDFAYPSPFNSGFRTIDRCPFFPLGSAVDDAELWGL